MARKNSLRSLVFGSLLAASTFAGATPMDDAMRCVHAAMTSNVLPVGVLKEQIANAALSRCYDEIEMAAAAIANRAKRSGVDAVRTALRVELYDFAMQVAGPPHPVATHLTDTSQEPQRQW